MNALLNKVGAAVAATDARGKATEYLRFALAKAVCATEGDKVADYFAGRWPRSQGLEEIRKAAVAPSTTTSMSGLVPLQQHSAALIEALRPLEVIGRMTGFRRIPFNISVPRITSGSGVKWVAQGSVTPLSRMSLDQVLFTVSKISGIVVITKELSRESNPVAESLIRNDMLGAIAEFTDAQFLDPTIAAIDDAPGSITYGATEVVSSGASTAAGAAADLRNLFAAVTTKLTAPYLVMRRSTAAALAAMGNTFPNVGAMGGEIWGVPVLTSTSVPSDGNSPSNNLIILIDAAEILLAEGDIEFRSAQHATLQFDDSPDSPPTASTVMISLWQRNLIGIGVNRYIRWARRREGSVAYLSGIQY